ncbi:glycosyltransferase family 4 protein [Serratia oryzae]|uniref:glycosyltransferase family 4 protein n=1 Tax=Serratia oryzae TaxID=2034155 RepID=UPI0012E0F5EE|nr:glycosyltransferase family 4 protein [Serratia oryzae]
MLRVKKIIISANTSWYIYNFRQGTIKRLINEGYIVFSLASDNIYKRELEELGVQHLSFYMDKSSKNPFKDIITFLNYCYLYFKIQPELVLNFTPKVNIYSTLAGMFFKAKIINNIAGLGSMFVSSGLNAAIAMRLYKITQSRADHVFFQNHDDLEFFLKNRIIKENRYSRLPGSGVNINRFNLTEQPADGVTKFILVGRIIKEKGIENYVAAAKKIKKENSNVEFDILGFIDEKNPASISKEQIREWERKGYINYLGTTDSVNEIVANYSAVVLPSYYREGVPKSLLEAASLGKPIITTDNIGCRETVIPNVTGFLCKPRDSDSLIEELKKFIKLSHSERVEMGVKGREYIKANFNEDLVIEKYINVINGLI